MALTPTSASGVLDVAGLVQQLMQVERRPLARLNVAEAGYQAQLSALGTAQGAMSTFQTLAGTLSTPERFATLKVAVDDADVAGATATDAAAEGVYSLEVLALATAHKLASPAFASSSAAVGGGTLTIEVGTYDGTGNTFSVNAAEPTKVITIAPGSTLAQVRDAINAASAGARASIVNDGTGARLVVTAAATGAAHGLRVTVSDDDGNATDDAGLSRLAYDPTAAAGAGKNLSQIQAAANASARVDGVLVTSASNTLAGAVEGLTLALKRTNAGAPTTVRVARDTAEVRAAVASFVNGYNTLAGTLKGLTAYNAASKTAGPLQGDVSMMALIGRLRSLVTAAIPAFDAGTDRLSDIGVSLRLDGSLELDTAKLDAAIATDPTKIKRVFATVATAGASGVRVEAIGQDTLTAEHDVVVTASAARGTLAGSAAAGLTVTAGLDDQLTVTVDGKIATITLPGRTYASAAELAADLAARLNGALAGSGAEVSVAESAGTLTITSNRYGSSSTVAVSGTAAAHLFGGAPVAVAGTDLQGTIDGQPVTGSGLTLSGTPGSAADGLRLAAPAGYVGSFQVDVTRGFASRLFELFDEVLGTSGTLAARTEGIASRIKALDTRRDALNQRLEQIERGYTRRFSALDRLLASLDAQSSALQQQLAQLARLSDK